jgi:cyclic pyranopterin phosphate synthase
MPLDEYEWLKVARILSFEELARLAAIFAGLGVRKIRLTGGEPLVRKDLPKLVAQIAAVEGIRDLAMTTNASRLVELAKPLADAGLQRLTVSLDTLRPERFRAITQRGDLQPVLYGLFAAQSVGFQPIKINAVIERDVNEDEIVDLAAFGREHGFDVRFIEYMDVGNANQWRTERLVPKAEILERIQAVFPFRPSGDPRGSRPADHYEYLDGQGGFGVIASVTDPFCGDCSRARLTADGQLVTCLFSGSGFDLKPLLRGGATDAEIADAITNIWTRRSDRYSETRLVALNSAAGYQPDAARKLEMIRLGG